MLTYLRHMIIKSKPFGHIDFFHSKYKSIFWFSEKYEDKD